MKKLSSLIVLSIVMVMVLVGCGSKSGSDDNDIVGKWSVTEVEYNGETMNIEDLGEETGVDVSAFKTDYEFKEDGTVEVSGFLTCSGTYKLDGTKLTFSFEVDGQVAPDVEATFEDGKITSDAGSGMKSIMTKQ